MAYLLEITKHNGKSTSTEYSNLTLATERAQDLRKFFGWTCVIWDEKGNVLDC